MVFLGHEGFLLIHVNSSQHVKDSGNPNINLKNLSVKMRKSAVLVYFFVMAWKTSWSHSETGSSSQEVWKDRKQCKTESDACHEI